jgi:hypothetical protein
MGLKLTPWYRPHLTYGNGGKPDVLDASPALCCDPLAELSSNATRLGEPNFTAAVAAKATEAIWGAAAWSAPWCLYGSSSCMSDGCVGKW